jgi:hypothetical protein
MSLRRTVFVAYFMKQPVAAVLTIAPPHAVRRHRWTAPTPLRSIWRNSSGKTFQLHEHGRKPAASFILGTPWFLRHKQLTPVLTLRPVCCAASAGCTNPMAIFSSNVVAVDCVAPYVYVRCLIAKARIC